MNVVVASPIQPFKQGEELSFFVIDQQIVEDFQRLFFPLRSACLQDLTDHKIYKMLGLEENRVLIENNIVGEMFEDVQYSLSDDPMMHLVLISKQVSVVFEEFVEEGQVVTKEHFQLRFVFGLKGNAGG